MKSVISTSKAVIPNIQHQTHKLVSVRISIHTAESVQCLYSGTICDRILHEYSVQNE